MIINILNSLINRKKKISINKLPSQGLFYKDDFNIFINKVPQDQIENYKNNINVENISTIINIIKKVVKNNISLSKNYTFNDIKSIDIIYIFLELVKFTKDKEVIISFDNKIKIEFNSDNFVYFFNENSNVLKYYSNDDKCFYINGYKFTLPPIGIEDCLTKFLIKKIDINNEAIYTKYYYDFTYFLGEKSFISDDEIENLIQIFNFELEKNESEKIKKIVELFIPMQKYKLKYKEKTLDLTSKVDLNKIWD
jgi:hypothetical protein